MEDIELAECLENEMNVVSDVITVIYYGEGENMKFGVLEDKNGNCNLIHEKVDEELDCYNAPLASGRYLLTLFKGLIGPDAFEKGEFVKGSNKMTEFPEWLEIWTHEYYYPWLKKFAYIDVFNDEIDHIRVSFLKFNSDNEDSLNTFCKENDLNIKFNFSSQFITCDAVIQVFFFLTMLSQSAKSMQ